MLTTRYHIATIIAIFLSLGIGIVIGGTLGQKWAVQAENSLVDMLMNRYEVMTAENQTMRKQIGSLELFVQNVTPAIQTKIIWWYKTPQQNMELLAMAMKASGVEWIEKEPQDIGELVSQAAEALPDYILVTDPQTVQDVSIQLAALAQVQRPPRIIDVSEEMKQLTDPQGIVDFMLYIKQLVEEDSYATNRIDHHAGLE